MDGSGSEELQEWPPTSPAILWFVNGCERKPKEKKLVNHYLAYFGAHRSSPSEDAAYLICHVTLQDYVIKSLCNFLCW